MKALRCSLAVLFFAAMVTIVVNPIYAFAAPSYPVAIDAAHFPDTTFRAYVSQYFDTYRDGQLSESEAANARYISLNYTPLTSLQGIEYFPNLQTLNCAGCDLPALDVSQNTALINLDCRQNALTSLEVGSNTALNYLSCSQNQLAALDVSRNTALVGLDCAYNSIQSLNVSDLHDLRTFSCHNNKLSVLDVTANTLLSGLSCSENLFTSLDLSHNTELTSLLNYNSQVDSLDLSANTKLQVLDCSRGKLTELVLSANRELTSLSCGSNQISVLNLSGTTKLYYLDCSNNLISDLNVSTNPDLVSLYMSINQISVLDVRSNPKLSSLVCDKNLLTSLDLSQNPALGTLSFSLNQLSEIDLSANTALVNLYCTGNRLAELDVRANAKLGFVECSNNELTELDLTANTRLAYAMANGNHLLDAQTPTLQYASFANQTLSVALQLSSSSEYTYESIDSYSIDPDHILTIASLDVIYATQHFYANTKDPVAFSTALSGSFPVSGTLNFTSNTVVVTFVDWDGTTVLSTQEIPSGSSAVAPLAPSHSGFTFAGWSGNYMNVTEDSTVTATYTRDNSSTYLVTFKDWDGTVLKQEAVIPGGDATRPADPNRVGYTFIRWEGIYENVQDDTTVTAYYEINTYTVKFVDWDGTELDMQTIEYGGSAMAPPDPVREGYTFTGWDNEYTNIVSNTTVLATYLINRYNITFVDWDGTILKIETVDHGGTATPPEPPVHEGYAFVDWNGNYTDVTEDATVVATFTIQTYTVTFFDWDGTVLKAEVVDYGGSATPPDNPIREGYTFSGWEGDYAEVYADTAVTATYAQNPPTPPTPPAPPTPVNPGGGKTLPGTGDVLPLFPLVLFSSLLFGSFALLAKIRRGWFGR